MNDYIWSIKVFSERSIWLNYRFDGLVFHYGNDTSLGVMVNFDGTGYDGRIFESYSNQMFIRFISNPSNVVEKGFNLTYRSGMK